MGVKLQDIGLEFLYNTGIRQVYRQLCHQYACQITEQYINYINKLKNHAVWWVSKHV